jgi:uncharacterized protein (DUF1919 family)
MIPPVEDQRVRAVARTGLERTIARLQRLLSFDKRLQEKFNFLNRIGLKNRDFTIVSDNCWGGFVYKQFGLKYKSPFVNLFLFPRCFIALLKDFERVMDSELIFIDPRKSKHLKQMLDAGGPLTYPVGVIGDGIELHFLHYPSEAHAYAKWQERKQRINRSNMLFKFCDRLLETPDLIGEFDALPYQHKVCLTKEPHPYRSVISVGESFDIKQYLNAMLCTRDSGPG